MPVDLSPVEPNIHVGSKRVEIGSLTWEDLEALVGKFAALDLPLPNLATDALRAQLESLTTDIGQTGGVTYAATFQALSSAVVDNLPVLFAWVKQHPTLVRALVRLAGNLTDEEVGKLRAADMFRIARAAWNRLMADGVFAEAAAFFLGLLGLSGPAANPESPSSDTAGNTPESASASTPA